MRTVHDTDNKAKKMQSQIQDKGRTKLRNCNREQVPINKTKGADIENSA